MLTSFGVLIAVLAILLSPCVHAAKPPTIPLACGKVANIKSEAERQYLDKASDGGDIYTVFVTYVGKKPTNKQVDAALRDCLSVASKKDGSKDILATAWYRATVGGKPNDDDQIYPYDGLEFISYEAASKTIGIRKLSLKRK